MRCAPVLVEAMVSRSRLSSRGSSLRWSLADGRALVGGQGARGGMQSLSRSGRSWRLDAIERAAGKRFRCEYIPLPQAWGDVSHMVARSLRGHVLEGTWDPDGHRVERWGATWAQQVS